jgi:hypothetical protein
MVFLIGFVFLFTLTTIAAAEQTKPASTKEAPAKEKIVKRQKTGKVLKISDSHLVITFKKKGVQEQDTMEFILTSPEKLSIGEKVTVFFIERKDGKREATRVKIKEDKKK